MRQEVKCSKEFCLSNEVILANTKHCFPKEIQNNTPKDDTVSKTMFQQNGQGYLFIELQISRMQQGEFTNQCVISNQTYQACEEA